MLKKRNLIFLSLLILGVFLITGCWLISTPTYTVTFDSQGGSAVDPQTVERGGLVIEPMAPTKADYTFAGWYKEFECTNAWDFDSDTVTTDVTLYAQWTINSYTVTFNKNGGDTEANPKTKTVAYGGNVGTLPTAPTRTGYTFASWNTKANGSGTKFRATTAVTADITVYAQWTINTYTVTFNKNDDAATGTMGDQTIASGSSANLTACAFTKTGWTFAGWATTSDGDVVYADQASYTMGNADVILYAKWTPPATYSLRDIGPAGGWIFYDDEANGFDNIVGARYLEAAPVDQTSRAWGTFNYSVSGADGIEIGTGKQNTLDIIAGDTLANKAADECANYSIVNGGVTYNDWFLPSKDELSQMYVNLKEEGVGGFAEYSYWSSSEVGVGSAWGRDFGIGSQSGGAKDNTGRVRAVRAF